MEAHGAWLAAGKQQNRTHWIQKVPLSRFLSCNFCLPHLIALSTFGACYTRMLKCKIVKKKIYVNLLSSPKIKISGKLLLKSLKDRVLGSGLGPPSQGLGGSRGKGAGHVRGRFKPVPKCADKFFDKTESVRSDTGSGYCGTKSHNQFLTE